MVCIGDGKQVLEKDQLVMLPRPFEWVRIPDGKVEIAHCGWYDVESFLIAKYPITVSQYMQFVEFAHHTPPQLWGEAAYAPFFEATTPIIGVSWDDSLVFCRWLSEKTNVQITLPTEQQWQRAAQGDDGRVYPWGNTFDAACCNSSIAGTSNRTLPVTQYAQGISPYGVMDMIGNVWEWTLSTYQDQIINLIDGITVEPSKIRVLRGGAWDDTHENLLRVDYRDWNYKISWSESIGFRVVCVA